MNNKLSTYKHEWYLKNRDKILESRKIARLSNPEFYKEKERTRSQKRRLENPDLSKETSKKYRALHPKENRAAQKKYIETHKEKRQETTRKYKAANLDKHRIEEQNRRARKRNSGGSGWTVAQEKALKDDYGNRCAYCNNKRQLTMDHVVPLMLGGRHEIGNIVPACGTCNSSKGAKPLLLWMFQRRQNA